MAHIEGNPHMSLPPVYSTLVASVVLSEDIFPIIGGPPPGYLWIIVNACLVWNNTDLRYVNGAGLVQLYNTDQIPFWSINSIAVQAGQAQLWTGRHVVPAGDTLQFQAVDLGAWTLSASGYQLSTP